MEEAVGGVGVGGVGVGGGGEKGRGEKIPPLHRLSAQPLCLCVAVCVCQRRCVTKRPSCLCV